MIVDVKDIEHVYYEITGELSPLQEKRKLMRSNIAKQLKKKAPHSIRNFTTYKRPGGNISWTIYYDIPKGYKADDAEFLFICSVETPRQKVFIILNTRFNGDVPPRDFLRIYGAHFLAQFQKRCEVEAKSQEELLAKFLLEGEISIFNPWDEESNEMRYINHWGFSLGRSDEKNCIVYFDTFVRKDMLFGDQKRWVSEMLNDAIADNEYKSSLVMYQYWHAYMDDDIMVEQIISQTDQPNVSDEVLKRKEIKKWLNEFIEKNKK
ncbi:hypothetical protein [Carboxylicivirga sp. N1Y90]|uniref:hypothetical protein n=1 Tax=Carboxylicivirga fragile TaxID=3417571 RepID=UPI003D337EB0|nr:hypothetical protein [Marinilabiliaceae bacterium N1Y90]